MERSEFLARIEQAVGADTVPEHGDGHPEPALPRLPDVDLTAHFIKAFGELDGMIHHDPPLQVIAKIMADRGVDEYLAWDAEHLPVEGLLDELTERGYRRIETVLPSDPRGRIAHQLGYFDVQVGVSAAVAALVKLMDRGDVSSADRVVVLSTGHGLKDVDAALQAVEAPEPLDCSIDAVGERIRKP